MSNPNKLTTAFLSILVCALIASCFIFGASAQSSSMTVNAQASATQLKVGGTLTVTLQLLNAQNIAGLDVTLNWNASVLTLANVTLTLGVEFQPGGVLHGNQLNYDYNSVSSGDIYVAPSSQTGSYELIAQSIGSATPSFNGNGNMATLTFNVVSAGSAGLALDVSLADHPASGQDATLITPATTVDSVTASVIPEFPSAVMLVLIFGLATAAMLFAKKQLKKK
jgi:hypothetical protein